MAKNASTNTKSTAAVAAAAPAADTVAAPPASAAAPAETAQATASEASNSQAEGMAVGQEQAALAPAAPLAAVQAVKADPAATRTYQVGSVPIRHDGRLYSVGSQIQLTEPEADRLSGLLIPVPEQG